MVQWLRLDVGGTIFQTTKETLTSEPQSMLAKMFDNQNQIPATDIKDNCHMIDSDPIAFKIILEWLRHRSIVLPEGITAKMLMPTITYFGLTEMEQALQVQDNKDWITINVGGSLFQTSCQTLMSEPDSYLAKIFQSDSKLLPISRNGCYILDEDPFYFRIILGWLRHQKIILTKESTIEGLLVLADYYELTKLQKALQENERHHWITLNVGGKLISTTTDILTSEPDSLLSTISDQSRNEIESKDKILLDHDPTIFEIIINWIRYGEILLKNGMTYQDLLAPVEGYKIPRLEHQLHELIKNDQEKQLLQLESDLSFKDDVGELLREIICLNKKCTTTQHDYV